MKKLLVVVGAICVAHLCHAQEQGIINNAESPHVKLRSINIGDCQWTSGFWADKFRVCEQTMVPYMGRLLKGDTGHAYNNFKIAAGLKEGQHQGMHWHDGDFYKWMESAVYVYAINKDQNILKELDEYIEIISKAQEEDSYLSTQVTLDKNKSRWGYRQFHELYNSGHLLTSACIKPETSREQCDFVYQCIRIDLSGQPAGSNNKQTLDLYLMNYRFWHKALTRLYRAG